MKNKMLEKTESSSVTHQGWKVVLQFGVHIFYKYILYSSTYFVSSDVNLLDIIY
jgi:hypothetical protein